MRSRLTIFTLPLVVLCVSASAADPPPAPDVDVASLVRKVRADELWLLKVKSFRFRAESHWTRTPQALAARAAELKKRFPREQIDAEHFTELKTESPVQTAEVAFDHHRISVREQSTDDSRPLNIRIWDGVRARIHEKYRNEEHYALDKEPFKYVGDSVWSACVWPEMARYRVWWVPENRRLGDDFYGAPEEFRLTGRENFRGVDCHVVECDAYFHTLYIGVADGRLYGRANRVFPRSANLRDLQIQIAKDRGATDVKDSASQQRWYTALSKEDRHAVDLEYFRRGRPLSVPQFVNFFSDYRELAPGRIFPMHQGYDVWQHENAPQPFISGTREIKVLEAAVDQPLPDDLFQLEFAEGVQVNDWGHDPPLFYRHKKQFPANEWQKILDDANARKAGADQRMKAMQGVVGAPAADFPTGATWLNTEKPLAWRDLKGQVVVVDFWATWCGPCRNDFPALSDLYKNRKSSGITLVSVHAAGTPSDEVARFIKEFQLDYPVCIDPADADGGPLFSAYRVGELPHAFVVGRDGKVAAHGRLAEVLGTARKLAGESKTP